MSAPLSAVVRRWLKRNPAVPFAARPGSRGARSRHLDERWHPYPRRPPSRDPCPAPSAIYWWDGASENVTTPSPSSTQFGCRRGSREDCRRLTGMGSTDCGCFHILLTVMREGKPTPSRGMPPRAVSRHGTASQLKPSTILAMISPLRTSDEPPKIVIAGHPAVEIFRHHGKQLLRTSAGSWLSR